MKTYNEFLNEAKITEDNMEKFLQSELKKNKIQTWSFVKSETSDKQYPVFNVILKDKAFQKKRELYISVEFHPKNNEAWLEWSDTFEDSNMESLKNFEEIVPYIHDILIQNYGNKF